MMALRAHRRGGPEQLRYEQAPVPAPRPGEVLVAVRAAGMRALGFGIQPRTPGSPALVTPKRRYAALLEAIGRPWLHFATTASDQVQVDITRGELPDAINVLNVLSPALIALTVNSSKKF